MFFFLLMDCELRRGQSPRWGEWGILLEKLFAGRRMCRLPGGLASLALGDGVLAPSIRLPNGGCCTAPG
jgi:hypothetical protein